MDRQASFSPRVPVPGRTGAPDRRGAGPGTRIPLPAYVSVTAYLMWFLASLPVAVSFLVFRIPWSLGLRAAVDRCSRARRSGDPCREPAGRSIISRPRNRNTPYNPEASMRWSGPSLVTASVALALALVVARPSAAQSASRSKAAAANGGASAPRATIVKPKARTVTGGGCRVLSDKTFSGTWGPSQLPTLAFTIGPGSTMADQMHASKTPFAGPGRYVNEIVAVYLGKTALEDAYMGLGTVTVNRDGRSGTFVLNDGSASGSWSC